MTFRDEPMIHASLCRCDHHLPDGHTHLSSDETSLEEGVSSEPQTPRLWDVRIHPMLCTTLHDAQPLSARIVSAGRSGHSHSRPHSGVPQPNDEATFQSSPLTRPHSSLPETLRHPTHSNPSPSIPVSDRDKLEVTFLVAMPNKFRSSHFSPDSSNPVYLDSEGNDDDSPSFALGTAEAVWDGKNGHFVELEHC
ncbi:uncharacterized protein EI90DRAFT_3015909 [Cantharellus anzutake]|uniref:uncharacterized protein n=1 Tax=Cantharellus anzutake TaxID=1750568 RepID=UPI0019051C51|nr:uncharacterized protein EI90DRAFT_3015909 [Cantharellus anzutake]KAF8332300.1 hypothetical protein EI90DRAFT_3015909 [Cantharellus anzutake]